MFASYVQKTAFELTFEKDCGHQYSLKCKTNCEDDAKNRYKSKWWQTWGQNKDGQKHGIVTYMRGAYAHCFHVGKKAGCQDCGYIDR